MTAVTTTTTTTTTTTEVWTPTDQGAATKFEFSPVLPSEHLELPNGNTVMVRPMVLSDYPNVRELMPKVSRCKEVYSPESVLQLLNCSTFHPYIVEYEGRIVGYAEIHRLVHLGRGFDARLEKVLVIEEMRGQKIAQVFCNWLVKMAQDVLGCGRVDLTVEKDDAKKVYGNLGFSKVDTEVWRLIF